MELATSGDKTVYGSMKFTEKLTRMIERSGKSQSRLMRETGILQTAISDMTLGKRRPYMDQALLLARALGVTLDYLADDTLDEIPHGPDLSEQEVSVLKLFRALRLSEDEALRRLATDPESGNRPAPGGVAQTIAERDLSGLARQRKEREEQEKRRLGFELESDCDGSAVHETPAGARKGGRGVNLDG